MAHDVFISYQQADKAIADAVCHRMEAAGVRCWIAPRDVAGEHWDDDVVDALTAAKVLVLIFSAAACASRDVVNEVKTAIDAGVTVIPFRIEDIRPTGGLGLHLVRVHWLDALTPPREAAIDQLIDRAKRNLPAAPEDDDQAAWRDAKARHTIAAYDHYLTTWPTGIGAHEAAEARRKLNEQIAEAERKAEDEAAWRDAKALHTVAAYDHYLTTWPTGIGALEAAAARRKAEDEAWADERRKAEEERRKAAEERAAAEARRKAQEEAWADEARRKAEAERVAEARRRKAEEEERAEALDGRGPRGPRSTLMAVKEKTATSNILGAIWRGQTFSLAQHYWLFLGIPPFVFAIIAHAFGENTPLNLLFWMIFTIVFVGSYISLIRCILYRGKGRKIQVWESLAILAPFLPFLLASAVVEWAIKGAP